MKQVELRKQLAKARAGLYRFLGGLYIMEVDAEDAGQYEADAVSDRLRKSRAG